MNIFHACCRIGIVLATTVGLSAAAAEPAKTAEAKTPDHVLEKIRYAADHCLQLRRWLDEEQLPTDADDQSLAREPVAKGDAPARSGADNDADPDTQENAEDDEAPELLLSSRFNGEACEDREDGAVIDGEDELPIALDAVRAVHEALTHAPEWIDEAKLPLETQGCWRHGATLIGVSVDREQDEITLYLDVKDCEGDGRGVHLLLRLAKDGARDGFRRENAIVAEQYAGFVCGTGLLEAAEAGE